MTDYLAILLGILLSLAAGAGIGWFLCQQRTRALCGRCQRGLRMDGDEWEGVGEDDDASVLPQCITCMFYTLSCGDGGWCYMFKEPPETEGECKQWKGKWE